MNNQELIKKISYIRGVADGIKLSEKSDEGKVICQLLEIIDILASETNRLSDDISDIQSSVEEMDDELLAAMSEIDELYEDINGIDAPPSFEQDDPGFDSLDYGAEYMDGDEEDAEDDDEDDELFELQCPKCGEDVMIDFDMIDNDSYIICPNCHSKIELEIEYDEDEDGEN